MQQRSTCSHSSPALHSRRFVPQRCVVAIHSSVSNPCRTSLLRYTTPQNCHKSTLLCTVPRVAPHTPTPSTSVFESIRSPCVEGVHCAVEPSVRPLSHNAASTLERTRSAARHKRRSRSPQWWSWPPTLYHAVMAVNSTSDAAASSSQIQGPCSHDSGVQPSFSAAARSSTKSTAHDSLSFPKRAGGDCGVPGGAAISARRAFLGRCLRASWASTNTPLPGAEVHRR